ncbi:MAG TPA: hypothetical protein VEF72_12470 [Mycobacterium sp.]|nr:hypothetical protein [Mycobacterium sp.]
MVFGELSSRQGYASFVKDLLDRVEHVVAVRRCFDVGTGLAIHHDIGDLADFDRQGIFGVLDVLDPGVAVVGDGVESVLQFTARLVGRLIGGLYGVVCFRDVAMMMLVPAKGLFDVIRGHAFLVGQ